ncbi:hypothetical protein [Bradyrhizobium sp. USDA 3364]
MDPILMNSSSLASHTIVADMTLMLLPRPPVAAKTDATRSRLPWKPDCDPIGRHAFAVQGKCDKKHRISSLVIDTEAGLNGIKSSAMDRG